MAQSGANATLANSTFRGRFRAWWEGEELALATSSRKTRKKKFLSEPEGVPFDANPFRAELNQRLWGDGHHMPWDTTSMGQFVKRMGLNKDKEILVLGAGLGGCVHELADFFGASVLGLEEDGEIARLAVERMGEAGQKDEIRIEEFDPQDLDLPMRTFGAAWINQTLFRTPDSYPLLKGIEQALVPSGHLMILDYVMNEPDKKRAAIDAWAEQEPKTPYLWTVEDYQNNLTNLRFHLLDSCDMTQHYNAMVLKAWSRFEDLVDAAKSGKEHREARYDLLLQEADLWARRANAIALGAIKVYAIHAMKPQTGKSMSDW